MRFRTTGVHYRTIKNGLAFGNAVRDLLFGDTVSGIIQVVQAILTAVTVAFGFALAILLWGGVFN